MSDPTTSRPPYAHSPSIANPYAPPPPPPAPPQQHHQHQQHQQQGGFMPVAANSYYQYQNGPAPMMDPNFIAFQQQQQQQQAYAQQFMMQNALHPSQQIYPPFQQPLPNQSPFPHHQQLYPQQLPHQQPFYNQNQAPSSSSSSGTPKKKFEFKNKTFIPNKDHSSYLKPKPQTNGHVNNKDVNNTDNVDVNNDTQQQQQQQQKQDQQSEYDSSISTPSIEQTSPDHNNTTTVSSPPSTTTSTPIISASNTINNHNHSHHQHNNNHNNNQHNNSHNNNHNNSINENSSSSNEVFRFQIQPINYEVGKPLFFGTTEAKLNSQKKKFKDIDEAKKAKEEQEEAEKIKDLKKSEIEVEPKNQTTIVEPKEEFKTPSPEPPKPTVAKWSFIAEKAAKKQSPKTTSLSTSNTSSPIAKKEESTTTTTTTTPRFVPSISNVLEPLGVVLLRSMFDKNFQKIYINSQKLPSIIPRGLVNTGNICFMSSILQLLLYCQPFYKILNVISIRTIHSINGTSSTPLIDALIEFYKNFNIKLDNPDKKFGDSLVPEEFYKKISLNERFQHLKWGQQEDAEEFFGYLLDGLHEEFISSVKSIKPTETKTLIDSITTEDVRQSIRQSLKQFSDDDDFKSSNESNGGINSTSNNLTSDDGWHEVGSTKNKISAKRTVEVKPSPIRQLFGGQFRSILDIPKQRESQSITLDPFQQIQLDISDDSINTLEDAFKNISNIEEIPYKSNDGSEVIAKKQTFIDKLPEVLVVHLKRFSFISKSNNQLYGHIEKIRKKISYKSELKIPEEVISPSTRKFNSINLNYKLTGIVYHHGISSEGGHYTVDVLNQSKDEWIRFDDTIITELSLDDVLSGGDDDGVKTAYILMYERV
ncbi:Ubiquitin carboxyl-terminal hydrolase [Wickerhamomyces ciferrii]|uniref:Ubiquitin carboxyl-terminal hydrolase n=1 Tax=Wickerhamomyces ciferrii (strain ATCC 14091 / BCRC 22168 / CBS 111 / JCM 3599 / NBRC 0793 / NRRL Y-1031 F-60-10) TaxID=1206466 RepID=K0KIC1_WICCF|nr:Ubiquitin carboxyl-terminal hydrolase [Wickerhamomyces ciferrii]CCH40898.1 Ubiquitin carboxyl-terminal hydrolase [Wickerhamomyces ciferrii]